MTPKFANILNYRVNATEVILDFGAFFPKPQPGVQTPTEADFHTRIIMGADVLDALLVALPELKKSRDQAREQQKKSSLPADTMNRGTP